MKPEDGLVPHTSMGLGKGMQKVTGQNTPPIKHWWQGLKKEVEISFISRFILSLFHSFLGTVLELENTENKNLQKSLFIDSFLCNIGKIQ